MLRTLVLTFLALGSAACATTPAPIASSYPRPASVLGPPVDSGYGPRVLPDTPPQQCVPFARSASGIEIYGDANTWWVQAEGRYPRSQTPAPGSVLVMRGYNDHTRGHVAVVTVVLSERQILVDQANWLNQGEISLAVPVYDVSPNNDWTEVRVWYIPNNAWGGRTYQADGFIHPFALGALS